MNVPSQTEILLLLLTLALSVTSFPVLCFVPIFHFPPPHARSSSPIPRLSNINV